MADTPVRIGLLAASRIAGPAVVDPAARTDGVEVVAVAARSLERAQQAADRWQLPIALGSYDELIAHADIDAVYVGTPNALHRPWAVAAAKAGKHVLVEKPMATAGEEARAMVDACRTAGVKLGVAYHLRWHRGHRALHERVRAGELGELRHVRAHWSFPAPDASNWRASPELTRWWGLSGVGTHCLDQVRWFLRPDAGEVSELKSVVSNAVFGSPHDETAILALRFESGATAEICTSVLFGGPRRLEIYGAGGHALCEDTLGLTGGGAIVTHAGPLEYPVRNPYVGEIEDFADAIREGRAPEVDGEEGLRNVELLLQAVGAR